MLGFWLRDIIGWQILPESRLPWLVRTGCKGSFPEDQLTSVLLLSRHEPGCRLLDEHGERDPRSGQDPVACSTTITAHAQGIGQHLIIQEEIPGHINETMPNLKKKIPENHLRAQIHTTYHRPGEGSVA